MQAQKNSKKLLLEELCRISSISNPYDIHKELKEFGLTLKSAYLSYDMRTELRVESQRIWDAASSGISKEKQQKAKKHKDWMERQYKHLGRWASTYQKNDEYISNLQAQITKIYSDINNSNNQNFIDKATGWIEEKVAKIQEVQDKNKELESKILDVKSKLEN